MNFFVHVGLRRNNTSHIYIWVKSCNTNSNGGFLLMFHLSVFPSLFELEISSKVTIFSGFLSVFKHFLARGKDNGTCF